MSKALVNERNRLNTLHSLAILDSGFDHRFDQLAIMAKRAFNVPIAQIGFTDEHRHWFKSSIGLDVQEVTRDAAICSHTILDGDILVIPDARNDLRFKDNPSVIGGPGIRFYAGCPLRDTNKEKVGALCIKDTQVRVFRAHDEALLKDLAKMVESELQAFRQSNTDDLTKLKNRRGFYVHGQRAIDICSKMNRPATLVFLDIRKLREINNRFGHSAGDHALHTFANFLSENFRASDCLARIGGDEFVALLPGVDIEQTHPAISRFELALDQYNQTSKQEYDLHFSQVVIEFDAESHSSLEDLMLACDPGLITAKNS